MEKGGVRRADGQPESYYTMEVGRLKERVIEAAKVMPKIFKQSLQLFVVAMKTLGKSEAEIRREIQEIVDEGMASATTARETADERYKRKTGK